MSRIRELLGAMSPECQFAGCGRDAMYIRDLKPGRQGFIVGKDTWPMGANNKRYLWLACEDHYIRGGWLPGVGTWRKL